ncbi:MAG: small subunit ribosomal protein S8 [Parcubacteria group bacterium Gr01-1014_72]|nr:MAG: small subunit ribosomal protein S8 [Parcubacteria group bacterium Gr01-1014_72]
MTDPISQFITQLKNASVAHKEEIVFPYSKLVFAVAALLKEGGWVADVTRRGKKQTKTIEVKIAYVDGGPRIQGVSRVSKPSRRIYKRSALLYPLRSGFGRYVLSTTNGILFGEDARKARVGGEVLFKIW